MKLPSSSERTDEDIARAAVQALHSHIAVPSDRIKVTVRDGLITLEGDVEWQFQKEAAESGARYLIGVKGITNLITVKPRLSATDVQAKIEEALRRTAELDAQRIKVETKDGKVILSGSVPPLAARKEGLNLYRAPPLFGMPCWRA